MAAATNKSSKRKSTESNGESTEQMLKKVKVAKSADRPRPTRSALKAADNVEKKKPAVLDTAQKAAKKDKKAVPKDEVAAKKADSRSTKGRSAAKAETQAEGGAISKATKSESVKPTAQPAEKKSKKASTAEEELVDSDEEDGQDTLTADQTAALMAGFDSSDDEDDEEEGIPLAKLPKAPVDTAQAEAAADAAQSLTATNSDPEKTPGVIYIGRIPHGFFEKQMKAYFGQFGDIKHLRLARSKKTKRSMHYAFVEFASSAVADIVAKTMDKYLMFNHILQVRRVPSEQVKENMWKGEGKRKRAMPLNRIEGVRLSKGTTKEGWEKRIQRETKKRSKNAAKLAEIGYTYEAPALKTLGEGDATTNAIEGAEKPEAIEDKPKSNSGKKRSAVAVEAPKKSKKTKTKA